MIKTFLTGIDKGRFFGTIELDGKKLNLNVFLVKKDGTPMTTKTGKRVLSLLISDETESKKKTTTKKPTETNEFEDLF